MNYNLFTFKFFWDNNDPEKPFWAEIDGKPTVVFPHEWERYCKKEQVTHRMRRGKLVEIPEEWRGKIPHKQTMRKRNSKQGQLVTFKRKKQR